MKTRPNAKRPYTQRGTPAKNPAHLRRLRAYARGASKPGDRPNPPRQGGDLRNPAYDGPDGIFAGYGEQGP